MVNVNIRSALILTTFNWPTALNAALRSLESQAVLPDQVIICDDGSNFETTDLIRDWMKRTEISVKHVWQPDTGFRAARIRNLGVLVSDCEHLIFLDGDCLMPDWFVLEHRRLMDDQVMVSGNRRMLSPSHTEEFLCESAAGSKVFFSGSKFVRIRLDFWRDWWSSNWEKVRTCNLSIFKSTLMRVAGFDESYLGWGREDSDLVVRLLNIGVKIRSGRYAATVEHLFHGFEDRASLELNDAKFNSMLEQKNLYPAQSIFLED